HTATRPPNRCKRKRLRLRHSRCNPLKSETRSNCGKAADQSTSGGNMNRTAGALILIAVGLVFSRPLSAQEKSKPDDAKAEVHPPPVKIQVVFAEFDGDKKVKSMPYTSHFTADAPHGLEFARLRIGSRVPLYTGKENGLQYVDVGMNIDLRAERLDD